MPAPESTARPDASQSRKVLLVEDSPPMRAAMVELMRTLGGFEVIGSASSEMEATDWLQQHPDSCDVVTVDLMLGEGSGFNVIRRCRAARGTGHVVVLSEYASPAVKAKCIEFGANAAFRKSELSEFIDYLEHLPPADRH